MSVMEYFEHSYNLRNDFKVRVLRNKFGIEGYGIYLCLIEILAERGEIRCDSVSTEGIALDLNITVNQLNEVLDFCIGAELLTKESDAIFSKYIRSESNKLAALKEKRSNAGKKGMKSRWANTSSPTEAKFVRPTLEEVRAYCSERNNGIDAESFINFYESKGWKVGKNSMKNWKAAIRTWENRDKQGKPSHNGLGVGEYILDGKRTYGDGRVTIPTNAPARPSEQHLWDSMTQKWIIL